MPFFGPGGLGSTKSQEGLDPQLLDALMQQFPGLSQLGQGQQQQPNALQGYQWAGPQFFPGQGVGSLGQLSPFEGAKGFGSESITAGLALGNYGKSGSQQTPTGQAAQPFSLGQLSLPSLQLPQQVAAQQGGAGEEMLGGAPAEAQGGVSINAGDVLGAGQQALDLFSGGSALGQQTTTPGYAEQRAGERTDYSNLTGSPSGIPQSILTPPAPLSSFLQPGFGADTTFSMGLPENFGVLSPSAPPQSLTPGTTFEMPGAGPTSYAPGGSAQNALGPEGGATGAGGDLLGGGLSTLQGLMSLYQGAQTGNVGQLLGGGAGTIGGLGQMAPETMAALSQQLGLGAGGLGLAAGGLGGLAGAYGLYQGIDQGDPMQAVMGAGGLYAGAAPLVNAAFGTALPTLSSLAGSGLSALGVGTGTAAGTAAAGGATAAGAGAGAGAGAAAGTTAAASAALAPLAMIVGPYLAVQILEAVAAGTADKEDLFNLMKRSRELGTSIPGHIAAWQQAPGLMQQAQATSDPQEAARLFSEMQKIQDQFQSSGMEGFLKEGGTSVVGSRHGSTKAQDFMPFEQGPAILKSLSPYTQALDYGRMLAQDKAAKGGINVPGALTAENYALNLGGPQFNEQYRPEALLGSSQPNQGALLKLLGLPIPGQATLDADPSAAADPSVLALLGRLGNVPQFTDPSQQYTNQDIQNYLGGAGADTLNTLRNEYDLLGNQMGTMGGVGKTNRAMAMQLQGLQPGGIEAGLRGMLQQGGWQSNNPYFSGQFDQQAQQMQQADPMLQALQRYQQQLQGVQGGLGQVSQGLQQQPAQGMDPAMLAALQQSAPGFGGGMNSGGGVDLQALLRQMGLAA